MWRKGNGGIQRRSGKEKYGWEGGWNKDEEGNRNARTREGKVSSAKTLHRLTTIESDCLWVVTSASSFPPYFGINTGRISSSRQLVKIISIPLSLSKLVKVPPFFHTVFSLLLLLLLLYKEIIIV